MSESETYLNILDLLEAGSPRNFAIIYDTDVNANYSVSIEWKNDVNDDDKKKYHIRLCFSHNSIHKEIHGLKLETYSDLSGLLPKALYRNIKEYVLPYNLKSNILTELLKDFETKYKNGIPIAANRCLHFKIADLACSAAERLEEAIRRGKSFFVLKFDDIEYQNAAIIANETANEAIICMAETKKASRICHFSSDEAGIVVANEAIAKANEVSEKVEKANEIAYNARDKVIAHLLSLKKINT
jgi:hypothetical protein